MNQKFNVHALCEGAVMIALAQGLGYLRLWRMPLGGSVTLSMLPIVIFAIRWGAGPGVLAGFSFGILQVLLDGAYAWGWQSILGDYLLAFAPLGLAGLLRNRHHGLIYGVLLGSFARFLVHWIVGATVWADSMPETFTSPWVYSLFYNGTFMGLSALICAIAAMLLEKPLERLPVPHR